MNMEPCQIKSLVPVLPWRNLQMKNYSPRSWRQANPCRPRRLIPCGFGYGRTRKLSPRVSVSWDSASPWMSMCLGSLSGAGWVPRLIHAGLPKGLDFFAAMGSDEAYDILDEMGETQFTNFDTQMTKVQDRGCSSRIGFMDAKPVLVVVVFIPAFDRTERFCLSALHADPSLGAQGTANCPGLLD